MMKSVLAGIAVAGLSTTASAEDHTASWFAAHPREMNAQIASCMDDPGHGKYVPNCANASQGQILLEAAQGSAQFNAGVAREKVQQEQQWRANPQQLLVRLKMCNASSNPAVRSVWNCDQAFAIAQAMAGHR